MSPQSIFVSYNLYPPAETPQPTAGPSSQPVPSSATFSFPIPPPSLKTKASTLSTTTQYYTSASAALLASQATLNEKLTYWKDAIGDREKAKEDVGAVGFGRGKAMMMSNEVIGEMKNGQDQGSSEEEEE
ncbi:hypothetical protein I312_103081 [Cryptococcus bacillisporus CA1280]|uniref:Uncharacterized protein n=2 Tax=Cryptococcus gattii TaxID=552467 RepID=A0A0D0VQT0_CRYGA|nr:hypothetical protein I312_03362 [Cryptococcus bacillisporus CA1280]KIR62349.1 hypothetical protein I314_03288 [Cryptococcus bacillisporus CA1873]|eukprot:KIR62349.1 hypothetical protein I314_03288 [Cryptococcus gattii CA1873]